MSVQQVKIRATVKIGGMSVSTPYIQSFNVRRVRGQPSTFDASLKVNSESMASSIGGPVQIFAGEGSPSNLIFTGYVKKATLSPCWDDPGFVFLNVSGEDNLGLLQGKKYTRRCRTIKNSWVSIDGIVREGLRGSKFDFSSDYINAFSIDGGKSNNQRPEASKSDPTSNGDSVARPPKSPHGFNEIVNIGVSGEQDEEVLV